MANQEDDRKSSWSSWFAPGDSRGTEAHRLRKQDSGVEHSSAVTEGSSTSHAEDQDLSRSELHPLVAFKHFVDDSFSAIAEFHQNLKELGEATKEKRFADEEIINKAYKKWTGNDNTERLVSLPEGPMSYPTLMVSAAKADSLNRISDEAKQAAARLLLVSWSKNQEVKPWKLMALCDDPEFNPQHFLEESSPWPIYHSDRGRSLSVGLSDGANHVPRSGGIGPASRTRWLSVNWFKHSPYSPVNLEADHTLAKYDTKWRNAFEDLLEAALDKPMTSSERFGYRPFSNNQVSTWRGSGLDWMLSLQCRGILPPQVQSIYEVLPGYAKDINYSPLLPYPRKPLDLSSFERRATPWHKEFLQLARELGTPFPNHGVGTEGWHDAPVSSAAGFLAPRQKQEQLMLMEQQNRYRLFEAQQEHDNMLLEAANQSTPYGIDSDKLGQPTGSKCPDELGQVVSEAAAQSWPDTELDVYERLERQTGQSAGRCPDDLGRVIGDIDRRKAARAFADQENDFTDEQLEDLDIEAFLATQDRIHTMMSKQDRQSTSRCPDDLGRAVGDLARQKAARAFADEENGLTNELLENLDIEAFLAMHDKNHTTLSKQDLTQELERLAFQHAYLKGIATENHESYIASVAHLRDKVAMLQEDQKELSGQLSEARGRLEQMQKSRMHGRESHPVAAPDAPVQSLSGRPQVLSTLTTTQTTRLPDGGVKTTVVLKRRFADGLEETQESTQTSFDDPATAFSKDGQDSSKKGWFWS